MANDPKTELEKDAQLDAMMDQMPAEIVQAVTQHGFHKLAAKVYGLPEDFNERAVGEFFGTKIAESQAEWRQIVSGLKSLQTLKG